MHEIWFLRSKPVCHPACRIAVNRGGASGWIFVERQGGVDQVSDLILAVRTSGIPGQKNDIVPLTDQFPAERSDITFGSVHVRTAELHRDEGDAHVPQFHSGGSAPMGDRICLPLACEQRHSSHTSLVL